MIDRTMTFGAVSGARQVPQAAGWVGGFGLVPFVAGAGLALATDLPWAIDALRFYAAVILSFLGGVHWGLAIADFGAPPGHGAGWTRLGGSVLPALIAWVCLLLPPAPGLLAMALAFAALLAADLLAVRRALAPPWYPRLRIPLTFVVAVCLTIAGVV